MPELRIGVSPELFEEVQRLAALNQMSLRDIGAVLVAGGIEEQKRRPRDE